MRSSQCGGLFPWRGGALNACRAFNFAAAPWKFARKLAARPTYSAQHRREIERFRPYCFPDSGGLGATANASAHFSYLLRSVSLDRYIHMPHHRPSSQVTLGSAQTRQGTLGSLDSPSAAASSTERRSALKHRRKPRPSRRSAVASHLARTRNAPQRSSRHHGGADRVA